MTGPVPPLGEGLASDVDAQAAHWFARSRSGEMSAADRATLDAWLVADPAHAAAFDDYAALWGALGEVRDDPDILGLREDFRARRRPWRLAAGLGVAASILLALALWSHLLRHPSGSAQLAAGAPTETRFETGIGQVSRIALSDGSSVVIDTDSALKAVFDGHRRRILLERGRAYFHVAHETRPFIVSGAHLSVTATGTEFVVDLNDARDTVSMVEGSVIAAPLAPTSRERPVALRAGRSLTASAGGAWRLGTVDIERERDWLTGDLTFRNERLDVIAREMNRYSQRKIRFADESVSGERISAILRAGDNDTLVSAVRDLGIARVSQRDANGIYLSRK